MAVQLFHLRRRREVVRERLRQLRPRPKQEAFFTREYGPSQMLQVDWADFGFALPGCARRVSAFVAALAFSRSS